MMLTETVKTGSPMKVLLVDDNLTSLQLLEHILGETDYETLSVDSGNAALEVLENDPGGIDILLLDRIMPGIDGIEVCERMKASKQLRSIPIVMQTAATKPEEISEGLKAGVFYYLTKPINPKTLISVLAAAAKEVMQYRRLIQETEQRQNSYGLISSLTCEFRTLVEAGDLATFLAQLFPEPERTLPGISELLINSVEHGNLEISYDQKTVLNEQNRLGQEIDQRLSDPVLGERKVTTLFTRQREMYSLQIIDEGKGFAWREYLNVDPSRVLHNHGRGIAMAKILSFDEVVYQGCGNHVICTVYGKE